MEKFNELMRLYANAKAAMAAICIRKGGIDADNYAGRFFIADLLELAAAFGEKAGADVSGLKAELEKVRDDLTQAVRPIHEMTLAEFEKMIGNQL